MSEREFENVRERCAVRERERERHRERETQREVNHCLQSSWVSVFVIKLSPDFCFHLKSQKK